MKNSAVRMIVCTVMGLLIAEAAQAAHLFSDDFEIGTAGATIGAPWGLNGSVTVTSTYADVDNPFLNGGAQYADLNDADPTPGSGATIRLLSHAGADTSLVPFVSGQITTYSFDFVERSPNEAVGAGLIMGYYRQQGNPDLNSAGRNYSSNLHDGSLNPVGTLLGGAATTYTTDVVNTVFMIVNDSASSLANYQPGRTLADTSADFWIFRPGDASPVYAFSVDKQSVVSAVAGVGLRTNSGDTEHFAVDNVFLNSGATFDRSAAGPAFPTIVVNRSSGEISLQNRESVNINVKGYTISSAIGALNVAAWDSIADTGDQNSGNGFDPTSVWTETSATNLQIAESANTGTGGVLQATTGNRSLGEGLWVRSPFQDLVATYTASDGSTVSCQRRV